MAKAKNDDADIKRMMKTILSYQRGWWFVDWSRENGYDDLADELRALLVERDGLALASMTKRSIIRYLKSLNFDVCI